MIGILSICLFSPAEDIFTRNSPMLRCLAIIAALRHLQLAGGTNGAAGHHGLNPGILHFRMRECGLTRQYMKIM